MEELFFSIVIPTFNRAKFLSSTLRSIQVQSLPLYEVLIVDDGGTDETEEVIRSLGDERFRYLQKENGERGAARNFGWSNAIGRYITFLDSDDLLYPNHLETAYRFLLGHPDVKAYAQAFETVDAKTKKIIVPAFQCNNPTVNTNLLKGNVLSCFGVFLLRNGFQELSFNEVRMFSGTEDWLLWLQIAARAPFVFNNTVTGALQQHNDRSVLSFKEESLRFRAEYLRKVLLTDDYFIDAFGEKAVRYVYAHMLSYASLHLAMGRQKRSALVYLLKAVFFNPHQLPTRRSLAITKKIFVTFFFYVWYFRFR